MVRSRYTETSQREILCLDSELVFRTRSMLEAFVSEPHCACDLYLDNASFNESGPRERWSYNLKIRVA